MDTAENLVRIQNELKKKASNLKTVKEEKKHVDRRATQQIAALQRHLNENRALKQDNTRLIFELGNQQAIEALQLKDPKTGQFSRETVKCIIKLIGEHEVSASRSSHVSVSIF